MNFLDRNCETNEKVFEVAVRSHNSRDFYPLGDNWSPWIPFSVKKENVKLAYLLMRFSRQGTQVGLFVCEDHHWFPDGSAAWLATVFVLSGAYFRTGSFAVEFIDLCVDEHGHLRESPGRIPDELGKLCSFLQCPLNPHARERAILAEAEGKLLFIGLGNLGRDTLTGFGHDQNLLLQAALLYRRGVWRKQSLDYIARYSLAKRSVLVGSDNLLFLESPASSSDRNLLEIALAGEYACGWLAWQMRNAQIPFASSWEGHRTLAVSPGLDLNLVEDTGRTIRIAKGQMLRFLLVPGYLGYYEFMFEKILNKLLLGLNGPAILVVTPNLRQSTRALTLVDACLASGKVAGVFYLPECVERLSNEVARRLKLASSTAHEPPLD